MEEGIGGAVLGGAVPSDAGELHGVDAVRPADGAPEQPAGGDHQRLWVRHRAHLRHHLLGVLQRHQEAEGLPVSGGGAHFHRRPHPPLLHSPPHRQKALRRRRNHLRPLQHHDVCLPLNCHG